MEVVELEHAGYVRGISQPYSMIIFLKPFDLMRLKNVAFLKQKAAYLMPCMLLTQSQKAVTSIFAEN